MPLEYRHLFNKQQSVLGSHRAWDAGALLLARELAKKLNAPLIVSEITRLLIDLNRSLHHRVLFSEFTRDCDKETRNQILQEYYFPYRNRVENEITKASKGGKPVVHFSIHSFTPRLGSEIRKADIGLLYDPTRKGERDLCIQLQAILQGINHLRKEHSSLTRASHGLSRRERLIHPLPPGDDCMDAGGRITLGAVIEGWGEGAVDGNANQPIVRRNYPYRGNADGFTTYLRKKYPGSKYIGIEIEINQKQVNHADHWKSLREHIINSVIRLTI